MNLVCQTAVMPMRRIMLLIFVLLISACASVPPATTRSVSPEIAWLARKSRLATYTSWELNGRIAIKSTRDSWSAAIHWTQNNKAFDINLMNHFGQTVAQLRGHPGRVMLQTAEESVTSTDVSTLLQQRFGWDLPVQGLRYWVLGLPDYHKVKEMELDQEGRLKTLAQLGWHIEFERYRRFGEVEIPGRLLLEYPSLNVRLVVDRWKSDTGSASVMPGPG
jgi:outer membrane lipoprotein LolB